MEHVSTLHTNDTSLPLTAFGEVLTAKNVPHVAWRFDYGVNTRLITATTTNGGTVTINESKAVLQTSTAVNGSASVMTRRVLRYLPGVGALVRFTAVFGTPKANTVQIVGVGNLVDGFFFGYNGLHFGVMRRRNGVDTWILSADFDGELPPQFNPQVGNIYSITYQWLGYGFIQFHVVNPHAMNAISLFMETLVHVIKYPNTTADVSVLNPTLPLFAYVANTGNATNMTLQTPSAVGFLQGGIDETFSPLEVQNTVDAIKTIADTNNNHAITIKNNTVIGAITNRVPMELRSISFTRGSSGSATSTVRLYRNATFAGALTYADVDAGNSPAQSSATVTTVTSVNPERAYTISSTSSVPPINFEHGELVLYPNDTLAISIQNSGNQSTDFAVTLNWAEQF